MDGLPALFPPLLAHEDSGSGATADVDIEVDDLRLPPLEVAVENAIQTALQRWNSIESAKTEATTLPYMERLQRYRALVRWLLYEDEDAPVPKKLRVKYRELIKTLPELADLRAQRMPSDRLQQFVDTFPAKKRVSTQKRSAADTITTRSFAFARSNPKAPSEGNEDDDDVGDNEPADKDQDDAAAAAPKRLMGRSGYLSALAESGRALEQSETETREPTKFASDDPILWWDVLHPSKDPAKTQSFLVRLSQPLVALVDCIACANDERLHVHSKQSKLVYFNRQFYTDRRHQDSQDFVDYGLEIRSWISARPSRAGKYASSAGLNTSSIAMETTRFADLTLQIDLPGVFVHQGECEHLLRLRDVRLPHELDDDALESFPMRLPNTLYRSLRNCFICQQYTAKHVCYGDRLSIADPMFFCERCYRAAHVDADGQLTYEDYAAFPYVQD